jgi:hypothetical protein
MAHQHPIHEHPGLIGAPPALAEAVRTDRGGILLDHVISRLQAQTIASHHGLLIDVLLVLVLVLVLDRHSSQEHEQE